LRRPANQRRHQGRGRTAAHGSRAWDEAVVAHAAMTAVQEQLVDVVRRALDLAASQERRPATVEALRTEAAALLA